MNILVEIIIPGVIITVANIFSHEHGSVRYENVTAGFGYIAAIFLAIWLFSTIVCFFFAIANMPTQTGGNVANIAFQIFALSVVTAISRDYEKIFKQKAPYMEMKIKRFYSFLIRKIKK